MDCRDCKHLKRFQRMIGGKPYCICDHEETAKVPVELFGLHGSGFICLMDDKGEPKIKSHPRWCPLRADKARKGQYVAKWDKDKGKITLKYKEDKDGAGTTGDQPD